jgi:hypothetical protein
MIIDALPAMEGAFRTSTPVILYTQTSCIQRNSVYRSDTERDSPESQAQIEGAHFIQELTDSFECQSSIA